MIQAISYCRSRPFAGLSLALVLFLAQPGLGQTPESSDTKTPELQPDKVETSLRRWEEEAKPQRGVQPPDGKWLTDEDGKQFFFDKYPKVEGAYRWIDEEEGIVRLRHMMPLKIHSHDDEFFYFKFYKRKPVEMPEKESATPILPLEVQLAEQDLLTLTPSDQGLPKSGQWRNGFVFADMNGDGHQDLVHGPARKSFAPPRIFLGDGSGSSWREWTEARYDQAPYDYGDVAVADFNGDGHQDLALAIHLTGVVVLTGDSAGRFEKWSEGLPVVTIEVKASGRTKRKSSSFSSRALIATDWTGDGRPDLLAIAEGRAVRSRSRTARFPTADATSSRTWATAPGRLTPTAAALAAILSSSLI